MSQKSFGSVFMDQWDKDEPLSKWWESKNVEKKGNCKRSQAYSLICKAWWRCCHGMGMHAVSGTDPLNFTDDLMHDDSSKMNLEGYKTILPTNIQENATRFIGKCFILLRKQWPKTPSQFSQGVYKGKEMESLILPKSISRFKSDWTWISPAEERGE